MRTLTLTLLCATALFAQDLGYVEMPEAEDGSYILASSPGSNRAWGLPETIRHLQLVAREWHTRHPDGPVLRIGDISKEDGSDFPPHKTHKDGCAIDITTRPNICHVDWEDQTLTAELAQLIIDLGATQILYNHADVQALNPSIIREWPKHDDHFHVVVDPDRVPREGVPTLVADAGWQNGAWLGSDRYDGSFAPAWRLIPAQLDVRDRPLAFDARVEVADADGTVLYDSGSFSDTERLHAVSLALPELGALRWRVRLASAEAELSTGWLELGVDLLPPTVTPSAPAEASEVDANPRLEWGYTDPGEGTQAWFEVEISTSKRQTRVTTLERQAGAATSFRLPGKLKKNRTHFWRVRVGDGHGNEAVSAWASFKPGAEYRWRPPVGRVTSETLNLRRGAGTNWAIIAPLPRGHEFYIVGERGDWLEVQTQIGDRAVEGFLHGGYIERVD